MKNIYLKIIAGLFYVAMVIVNFLANSLPINNRSTGVISDAYPNLFAPAGLTFSIWGLIYLLLGGYVIYQFVKSSQKREGLFKKINPWFIATSMANIAWIFAWHYDYIGLSVLIMLTLLVSLIKMADIIRVERFTALEKLFVWAPFSIYFGWITVATIANITVFFTEPWLGSWLGWFRVEDFVWTIIILLVGTLIGILRMTKDKNVVYGLVFVWAYLGILIKHLSVDGFNGQYPSIIATVIVCLALLSFFTFKIFYKK